MTDMDRARTVEVEIAPDTQPFIEALQRYVADLRELRDRRLKNLGGSQ